MTADDLDLRPGAAARPAARRWLPSLAGAALVLLCLLVLMLSTTHVDPQRYRAVAGAVGAHFGASVLPGGDPVPMGTAVVTRAFAPDGDTARPGTAPGEPAAACPEPPASEPEPGPAPEPAPAVAAAPPEAPAPPGADAFAEVRRALLDQVSATRTDAAALAALLQQQITSGEVEIEARGRQIVLRIREAGAFGPGNAALSRAWRDRLVGLRATLATQSGALTVRAHTDDRPVTGDRFRSAWALSAARAAAVAEALLDGEGIAAARVVAIGLAGTRPLVANDTDAHRARNRRVEIAIDQGIAPALRAPLLRLAAEDPAWVRSVGLDEALSLPAEENPDA